MERSHDATCDQNRGNITLEMKPKEPNTHSLGSHRGASCGLEILPTSADAQALIHCWTLLLTGRGIWFIILTTIKGGRN